MVLAEAIPQFSNYLQYGALGLLGLTLIGMFFLSIRVLAAFSGNTKVVAENTEVMRSFKDTLNTSVKMSNELMVEIKDLLLSRPCIREKN